MRLWTVPMPDLVILRMDALTSGGDCLGRTLDVAEAGSSYFVPLAAPGDLVRARIEEPPGRGPGRARIVELLEPSPERVAPPCPHFGVCGGCQWQHVAYRAQLLAKREIVARALERGGVFADVPPAVPSPHEYGYRHRAALVARARGKGTILGFRMPGSRRIVDLAVCPILEPGLAAALPALRAAAAECARGQDDESEVHAVRDPGTGRVVARLARAGVRREVGGGPVWIQVEDGGFARLAEEEAVVTYEVEGCTLRFSPATFTQANLAANRALVAHVLERLSAHAPAAVLDLYSGVGNYALPAARRGLAVHGVEQSVQAVALAGQSARAAGVKLPLFAFQAGEALDRFLKKGRTFDAVIANPPRTGLSGGVAERIARLAPAALVYVSCNPTTLARDLAVLLATGYRIESLRPFDLFPQTVHVETVVALTREA